MNTGSSWFILFSETVKRLSIDMQTQHFSGAVVLYFSTHTLHLNNLHYFIYIIHLYKNLLTALVIFLFRLRVYKHPNQPKMHEWIAKYT